MMFQKIERQIRKMSITGYYDGTVVQINKPLRLNQKVVIIPIESENDFGESAAGGLHKYADISLIPQEKNAWRKAAVSKKRMEHDYSIDDSQ